MTSTIDAQFVTAAEAARLLGVSRRRVLEVAASAPDFPPTQTTPTGGRIWPRPAVLAWAAARPEPGPVFTGPEIPPHGWPPQVGQVVSCATDEAVALNHNGINLDHLVLGMLHPDCSGVARTVLESFGLRREALRQAFIDSMGDPFDIEPTHQSIPPATQLVLERANFEAARLADAEVASEHVLLALTSQWESLLASWFLGHYGISKDTVRQRVVEVTEGVTPVELPAPLEPPPRRYPAADLDLAPNPFGHDPRRRGPWSQMPFPVSPVPEGQPLRSGALARGYYRDRDGYPVLTTDGRPVHLVLDENAMPVRDAQGRLMFGPVEVPPGCEVTADPHPPTYFVGALG
jgi:hypothetical protein